MRRITSQLFDFTPTLGGVGLPRPYVFDYSPRAIRSKVVAFAAKRYVDMMYVTGLSRAEADKHFRLRALGLSGDLESEPDARQLLAEHEAAWAAGRIEVVHDDAERRITVTWRDPAFGPDVVGRAIARPGYGGIVLGAMEAPTFDPAPVPRAPATRSAAWPVGDGGIPASARPASAELEETIDRLFAA
ncbi:MAG: hypothetical protein AB7O45_08960, partial [Alphaproteobacteria bacterium]